MLKKFKDETPFQPGDPVYIVTRKGEIIEDLFVDSVLFDLVSLNKSPLEGSEKQGFTVKQNTLKPNWCEGRKHILAAFKSKHEAEEFLKKRNKGKS